MFEELHNGLIIIGILFAIIGLYYSSRSWFIWKNMDEDTVRAKVFLTKDFLNENFKIMLIVGFLVAVQFIFELTQFFGFSSIFFVSGQQIEAIYLGTLTLTMLLMVLSAYFWYRLLYFKIA